MELPAVRLRADVPTAADQRRACQPRDYLRRDEHRRLLWRVMPPAVLLVILAAWIEHTFLRVAPPEPPPQVDTRLSGGPRGTPGRQVADAVLIEPEPSLLSKRVRLGDEARERWGSLEALDRVRDDTVFREADRAAWLALWDVLEQADPRELAAAAGPPVGFTELYGQPESFRGCPVRLRGTLRRLQWVQASPRMEQAQDADGYWQGWLDPEGGPPSPIVVYFRRLPPGVRPGLAIIEPVDVTGIFFKRWAYQASDTIRTAPLVLSIEPLSLATDARTEPPRPGVVAAFAVVFAVAAAVLVARGSRRRRFRRSGRVLGVMLAGALVSSGMADDLAAASGPTTTAQPATTADDYLRRFSLDATARGDTGPLTTWDDARQDVVLRLLPRLTAAPPDWLRRWAKDAVLPSAITGLRSDPAMAPPQGLVRVIGRAVWVVPLTLSPAEAERHARSTVDVVRIVGEDGTAVDVFAAAVPQAWPRGSALDEPADAVGVVVARDAGPTLSRPADVAPSPDTVPSMVVAAPRVAWRPGTPLGSLGMDYGLFDGVQDGRRLVAADADAFYAVLAAVGRARQRGIEEAAGPAMDVIPLIDPAVHWFEQHRGDAVRIRGTARRAIRISIDEPSRRDEVGSDHYWEVSVFVRTPLPLQVNGRLQDTYPIVCCMRELPPGMPFGERIAEDVDITGFAFKRYRYPLSDAAAEPGGEPPSQESPLLVGKRMSWVPASDSGAARRLDRFVGGLLLLGLVMLAVVAWFSLRRRSEPSTHRTIAPPPADQDAAAEHTLSG